MFKKGSDILGIEKINKDLEEKKVDILKRPDNINDNDYKELLLRYKARLKYEKKNETTMSKFALFVSVFTIIISFMNFWINEVKVISGALGKMFDTSFWMVMVILVGFTIMLIISWRNEEYNKKIDYKIDLIDVELEKLNINKNEEV